MPAQRRVSADVHFDHEQASARANAVASRRRGALARSRDGVAGSVRGIQEVRP